MHYLLYKITNSQNDMIYIGAHKTDNIDDDYMGSGTWIKRAIRKYGASNFTKEIIGNFDDEESMYEAEASLVTEDFVNDPATYNLKVGGEGGWSHIHSDRSHQQAAARKSNELQRWLWENDKEWREKKSKRMSEAVKCGWDEGRRKVYMHHSFTTKGRYHTDETKRKLSEKSTGQGNSQYGTMFIYNLQTYESKKIKKRDPIPEGWKRGRKMKRIA